MRSTSIPKNPTSDFMKNILSWLSVALLVIGVFGFCISYHGIDIAWNMDSGCMDKAVFGSVLTRPEVYMKSVRDLFLSLFLIIISYFLLSIDLNTLEKFKYHRNQ